MKIMTGCKTFFYLALANLALVPSLFAQEDLPLRPQQPYPGSGWCGGWGGYGYHGHFWWWIFPLMFFVLIIFLMARRCGRGGSWCDRMMGGHHHDYMGRGGGSESAMEILNQRYAKGEIDKAEYEEKKAVILKS